jgi:tungstate transport system substrate-binding protein
MSLARGPALGLTLLLAATACARRPEPRRLILATTTSVRDCGLLDRLIPPFEAETGLRVTPLAVGSGEALRLGRDGNADVLLVHDPKGEAALAADGLVAEDVELMRSRFVVVGPKSDPAGVRGLTAGAEVFQRLAEGRAPFASRGDDSGTHRREKSLWQAAGTDPAGRDWYLSSGAGMVHTLRVASERQAYCLTDTATWLTAKKNLDLEVLVDSAAPEWANVYSVLLLDPKRFPEANHEGARRFRDFLATGAGREIIRTFGVREFGEPIFTMP